MLCKEALGNDGYVATSCEVGDAESEKPENEESSATRLQGALTKEMLENLLVPHALVHHENWEAICAGSGALKRFDISGTLMADIMCALLSSTKAWTVFDKVDASKNRFSGSCQRGVSLG